MPNPRAETYFVAGQAKVKAGQYEKAVQAFTKAIALDAENPAYYVARGKVRHHESPTPERTASAYADFNKAIELDVCCGAAYHGRGLLKQYDVAEPDVMGALVDYDRAIECTPTLVEAYRSRALVHQLHTRNMAQALADYDEAVRLDPTHELALLNRGRVLHQLGEKVGAIQDFVHHGRMGANQLDPFMLFKGDTAATLAEINAIMRTNPNFQEGYIIRGLMLWLHVEPEASLPDFTRAIELNPQDWLAYALRGRVCAGQNELEQALIDLNTSLELYPDQWRAYLSRGGVYQTQGELRLALHDLEIVQDHFPAVADYYDVPQEIKRLKKAIWG